MDLSDRGRRVTGRGAQHHTAARPRPQAGASAQIRRHADRRCRRASLRERALRRIPAVHGKRRAAPARLVAAAARSAARHRADPDRLSGHGRPRDPLSDALDRERPKTARSATSSSAIAGWTRWASIIPACFRPACSISACIRRRKWRSICAGPTTAGSPRRCCRRRAAGSSRCCACRFAIPDAALRHVETFGDRKHVGGFMVTTVRTNMGVHDNAYMKVYRAMEERGLAHRLPFRRQLGRAGLRQLQPLHLRACARLHLVQRAQLHQLGGQRPRRALSQSCR